MHGHVTSLRFLPLAALQATCLRSGLPVALKVYFLNKVPPNAMHMIAREITVGAQHEQTHTYCC
mgnify:CR=1 FL=1